MKGRLTTAITQQEELSSIDMVSAMQYTEECDEERKSPAHEEKDNPVNSSEEQKRDLDEEEEKDLPSRNNLQNPVGESNQSQDQPPSEESKATEPREKEEQKQMHVNEQQPEPQPQVQQVEAPIEQAHIPAANAEEPRQVEVQAPEDVKEQPEQVNPQSEPRASSEPAENQEHAGSQPQGVANPEEQKANAQAQDQEEQKEQDSSADQNAEVEKQPLIEKKQKKTLLIRRKMKIKNYKDLKYQAIPGDKCFIIPENSNYDELSVISDETRAEDIKCHKTRNMVYNFAKKVGSLCQSISRTIVFPRKYKVNMSEDDHTISIPNLNDSSAPYMPVKNK